jgi:chaperonin GroEL (HSP60 family)
MGAQMVKVASKTNDLAGDGTTTATVLTSYYKRFEKIVLLEQSYGFETWYRQSS